MATMILLPFLFSCSDEKDPVEPDRAMLLVGTWTGTATIESATINEVDLTPWMLDAGYSFTDINILLSILDSEASGFSGTVTFREDGTFDFEGGEGTWEMINNDQSIVIDGGTENEGLINIVTLTNELFVGIVPLEDSSGDLDLDGVNDILIANLRIDYTKE
jgi:hypothetical protein